MPYPNINAERSRAGMTVEDLARHLGVTRKTVYNWMAHGSIPQSKLVKMSELFNCSIDYLLEREPVMKAHGGDTDDSNTLQDLYG